MTLKICVRSVEFIILFFSFALTSVLLMSSDSFAISTGDSFLNKTDSNNSNEIKGTVDDSNNSLLSLKILANSLENRLRGAASMLEFATNLSEMRSIPNGS